MCQEGWAPISCVKTILEEFVTFAKPFHSSRQDSIKTNNVWAKCTANDSVKNVWIFELFCALMRRFIPTHFLGLCILSIQQI